ncbi:hypothetical protein BJP05_01560 [Corynebacterium sp. NML98-0116]|nr:hypothetical protein BJP05_01560 [Corynebacterium sp. NML98-0116]OIR43863.1 hypothetical protein BJP06_05260 [Corynebacterium sp. NML120713]
MEVGWRMSTRTMRNMTRGRVIARSSDGRIIREARIHDPAENLEKAWKQTGQALRQAIDSQNKMMF